MTSLALYTVGVFCVSTAISYAWWVRVRALLLRQELLDIRDEMFDKAVSLKGIDDPAYEQLRDRINTLASCPHTISLLVMAVSISAKEHSKSAQALTPAMANLVDYSTLQVGNALLRSMLFHTLFGRALELSFRIVKIKTMAHKQILSWTGEWLNSSPMPPLNGLSC